MVTFPIKVGYLSPREGVNQATMHMAQANKTPDSANLPLVHDKEASNGIHLPFGGVRRSIGVNILVPKASTLRAPNRAVLGQRAKKQNQQG